MIDYQKTSLFHYQLICFRKLQSGKSSITLSYRHSLFFKKTRKKSLNPGSHLLKNQSAGLNCRLKSIVLYYYSVKTGSIAFCLRIRRLLPSCGENPSLLFQSLFKTCDCLVEFFLRHIERRKEADDFITCAGQQKSVGLSGCDHI